MFRHISTIVTGDDPSVKAGKPAPDIYLEASKRLGIEPKHCLVFEDAISGVVSAKAAGCFGVVAVPDVRFTHDQKQKFHEDGADVIVDDLSHFDGREFGINIH